MSGVNSAFAGTWEQRWHPLRREWVIVAAHRQDRPWSGGTVPGGAPPVPPYSPQCHFCPGNPRVSGAVNPDYRGTYVFENDHPCVALNAPRRLERPQGFYRNRPATGASRIVCYSPRHDLTLAELDEQEVDDLLSVWQQEYRELGSRPEVRHVLIFENKGEVVGVSNPHPHCQIFATNFVFKTIEEEARTCREHLARTGRVLFQDILAAEREDGRRIVCENASAVAFIPYFARYAYEVFVAPKATWTSLAELPDSERRAFAAVLRQVLVKLDNLWQMSFPYVMPLHQAPTDGGDYRGFHFHIEFHPPLRKPNLLKYLAGPEIGGGNFLSDTSPEEKALELRSQPEIHYRQAVERA
jgi:UDPglucose--hexose-1-phosphate uridylyltransferase